MESIGGQKRKHQSTSDFPLLGTIFFIDPSCGSEKNRKVCHILTNLGAVIENHLTRAVTHVLTSQEKIEGLKNETGQKVILPVEHEITFTTSSPRKKRMEKLLSASQYTPLKIDNTKEDVLNIAKKLGKKNLLFEHTNTMAQSIPREKVTASCCGRYNRTIQTPRKSISS